MKNTIFFFTSCFTTFCMSLFGQWNANTIINTPVVIAPKSQQDIHTVSDTKGGAILAWDDNRNNTTGSSDIYAQRLKSNGYAKWTGNGVAVCTNTSTQKSVAITEGGIDGSAIITWEDNRNGNYDIYAQKIDSSGNVLWTIDGIAVCNKTTNQRDPAIVSDNAGGAIIVWEDSVNFYWDIYAQHISSSGSVLWTSTGVAICNSPNTQTNPRIDVNGAGGAIITWQDKRGNVDYDIYAQAINASGTTQWTSNGVAICTAAGTQNNPRIEPDGSSGALIAWIDKRSGTDYNIYAQRINSSGTVQWTANGADVCTATGNQSALDMKYLGANGLALSWKDERSGPIMIYAQILNLSGAAQLTTNGIQLSSGLKSINPNNISDGNGGVIIAWQDSTNVGWDIKAQKLTAAGAVDWTAGGVTISSAADDQINVTQTTDGNGGAVFLWEDHRNFNDYDLYANHLFYTGTPNLVGIKELSKGPVLEAVCFPNPVTSGSVIKLNNNTLHQDWEISVYDAYGRTISTRFLKSTDVFEISTKENMTGTYFYFITLKDKSAYSKGSFVVTP
ncbi:MAG: T9SS type A sorting domain-containing protein [Bacteroidetes bacterium]|nr:T9SS type A sorting domain-containing protein [Bacteroidota bacterium]